MFWWHVGSALAVVGVSLMLRLSLGLSLCVYELCACMSIRAVHIARWRLNIISRANVYIIRRHVIELLCLRRASFVFLLRWRVNACSAHVDFGFTIYSKTIFGLSTRLRLQTCTFRGATQYLNYAPFDNCIHCTCRV